MNKIIKISIISNQEKVSIEKKIYYTEETKESVINNRKFPICKNLDKKYTEYLVVDGMYKNLFPPLFYSSKCIILEYYVWSEDVNDELIISLINVVENEFKLQKSQIEINLENIKKFKENYKYD